MSDAKLGEAPDTGARRDAVHVAVFPATAHEDIKPGQQVRVQDDGVAILCAGPLDPEPNGIADPFRGRVVERGESLWVLMNPNTTENLRHAWDHADLPDEVGATKRHLAPVLDTFEDDRCSWC